MKEINHWDNFPEDFMIPHQLISLNHKGFFFFLKWMHSLEGRLQAVCHLLTLSGTGQVVLAWIKTQVFKNQGDCVSQKAVGAPGVLMCQAVKMVAWGLSEVRSPSLMFAWPWVPAGPGTPEDENLCVVFQICNGSFYFWREETLVTRMYWFWLE